MKGELRGMAEYAANKSNFISLEDYYGFCQHFVLFISKRDNLQATIVCENEQHYRFFQYSQEFQYRVSRPINANLFHDIGTIAASLNSFRSIMANIRDVPKNVENSQILIKTIYSLQQAIGAALDALPPGASNRARKVNGDLFERLIQLLFEKIGVDCKSGALSIPIKEGGQTTALFKMNYQHDLVIKMDGEIKLIGSVKTTSKDRIDKVFTDKLIHNKLMKVDTPHIAVFLNDVQRAKGKTAGSYKVASTFLTGRFKGYTIKLNPLDGVYYCDIRPNMKTDRILKEHIKEIDSLFLEDIWLFVDK